MTPRPQRPLCCLFLAPASASPVTVVASSCVIGGCDAGGLSSFWTSLFAVMEEGENLVNHVCTALAWEWHVSLLLIFLQVVWLLVSAAGSASNFQRGLWPGEQRAVYTASLHHSSLFSVGRLLLQQNSWLLSGVGAGRGSLVSYSMADEEYQKEKDTTAQIFNCYC